MTADSGALDHDPSNAKIELPGISSVAVLLDEARELLVSARERGERPELFVVDPPLFDVLQQMRRTRTGVLQMVVLFGLPVEPSSR